LINPTNEELANYLGLDFFKQLYKERDWELLPVPSFNLSKKTVDVLVQFFKKSSSKVRIFNTYGADDEKNDNLRLQMSLPGITEGVENEGALVNRIGTLAGEEWTIFRTTVRQLLVDTFPWLAAERPVLTLSLSGCAQQQSHQDYPVSELEGDYSHFSKLPLVMEIPLSPDGKLVVLRQKFDSRGRYGGKGPETLDLVVKQAVIFRGDLVHAGAAYAEDNLRFHMYLHPHDRKYKFDVTSLTSWDPVSEDDDQSDMAEEKKKRTKRRRRESEKQSKGRPPPSPPCFVPPPPPPTPPLILQTSFPPTSLLLEGAEREGEEIEEEEEEETDYWKTLWNQI